VIVHCWKCGTPCKEDPGLGQYCPAKDCDVFDGVGMTPAEFEAHMARYTHCFAPPARKMTADEMRNVEALAIEAEKRGLVLLSKVL
jgi:hypothetical protein